MTNRQPTAVAPSGGQTASPRRSTAENLMSKMMDALSQQGSRMGGRAAPNKVTIVGAGAVGVATAHSLLHKTQLSELVLIDPRLDHVRGEALDLQQGEVFSKQNCKILTNTDYTQTLGSRVIILTAGAKQQVGESRLQLVEKNIEIFKGLIPPLVKLSPDAIFLVVTNPVDVMAYVTWRIGGMPLMRVFGSGTTLDSARFRSYIAEKLEINPTNCHGFITGEHGDSSVAMWSGVNVAGVPLRSVNSYIGTSKDNEKWQEKMHDKVIKSAGEIIKLKGYTSWAVGGACADLCAAILHNKKSVYTVSTNVKGVPPFDIKENVFLSIPCILGSDGVTHKITVSNASEEERAAFKKSAATLRALCAKYDEKEGIPA